MKKRTSVVYAVSISVAAHMMFFAGATNVKIPGVHSVLERSKRFFNIKNLSKDIPVKKPVKKRGVTYVQTLKFESPSYSKSLRPSHDDKKNIEKPDLVPEKRETPDAVAASGRNELDELMQREKEKLRREKRRETRKDLVDAPGVNTEEVFVRPEETLDEWGDFFDKMPGFTPEITDDTFGAEGSGDVAGISGGNASAISRKTDFTDIDQYLLCGLTAYEDPKDGEKYFRFSIRAGKDAENFTKIPKEIVFLIDCSLSTQRERLEEFKKGLRYSLSHLKSGDYFNLAAFKDTILWFRPRSIKPDESSIQDAVHFVDKLTAGEGTNTYSALYESIQVDSVIIPSYIVLFSDGRPTYGETNSMKILNEITRLNNGKRPIFAFSGGGRVNRYFLDFISYKNRGWTEYAPRTHFIGKQLARFYEKIKDPILLNLRYNIGGLDDAEIFPKSLPDFFRNAEFTLYGKYTDEKEFSLQFLGDSEGETNEFIIVGSMEEAAEGGEEIARNWAFNRIYHLIGLLQYGKENETVIEEINALSKRFKIQVPYSHGLKE
ncbi:MAG: VWA domain-containing protein [Candidatus Omnitrophota bacterium]